MESCHVDRVVTLHLCAFPDFFLTFLGARFLKEFYASFLHEPTGVAYVAEERGSGRILGVVVGTVNPTGFFTRLLKRRWWAFCFSSLAALWHRPTIAPRLFRALFYRGAATPGSSRALLSSIAVAPETHRTGIGHALLKQWIEAVQEHGRSSGCYLATDAMGNNGVNRFYQRAGWKAECSFVTPEGRKMHRYVIDFKDIPESSAFSHGLYRAG